ncbi:MAG: MBL fold metallo-hydrolase [Solirubrobacterales bacterium]|nr:MBL fold metallo-hydrolase [Solirubrobacterales bacterium]
MSTTQINQNLIQVNRYHFVNAFLVREDDGFTLVDTTLPRGAGELIAAARDAGAEIKRIALTHGHGDHVGSLDALRQQLGQSVEVLMPDLDARIHAGEKVVDGKLPGQRPKLATTPDVRLTGGERIGSLEVIPTPGHTPGHVSLLDTRDQTVIVGDVFTSIGGLAVSNHFNLRFPLAAIATWDKTKDLESAQRLRALGPSMLVVGHGGPVRNPTQAMDEAIAGAGG